MVIQENLLAGENIRLTGLRKSDVPTILKWREDTRFLRLWNSDPLIERSEVSLNEWIDEAGKTDRELTFAIRLHNHEELIGVIGITGIEWPIWELALANRKIGAKAMVQKPHTLSFNMPSTN